MSNKYMYTKKHHFQQSLERYQGKDNIPNVVIDKIKEKLKFYHINEKDVDFEIIRKILKEINLYQYITYIPSIINILTNKQISAEENNKELTEPYECPICFDEFNTIVELVILKCNHKFCKICVNKIKINNNIKCPLCRREQIISILGSNKLTDEQINKLYADFDQFNITYEKWYENNGASMINYLPFKYLIYKLTKKNNIEINEDMFDINKNRFRLYEKIWNNIYNNI